MLKELYFHNDMKMYLRLNRKQNAQRWIGKKKFYLHEENEQQTYCSRCDTVVYGWWITLIGGPTGRAGWRAIFPNEKRELAEGWWAAQKTEKDGLEGCTKKAVCGKGQGGLQKRAAFRPTLFCSPACCAARLNVQPTGPPCSAATGPSFCAESI